MSLRIGDEAPDFTAETTEGRIRFHEWIGDGWVSRSATAGSWARLLQLTAKHKVATPVNWKAEEDVIIAGSVSDEEAKQKYPEGWKAPRPYLRIVPQPKS